MSPTEAKRYLTQNFVNVVLTLVAIIQGFTFSFLTARLPQILDYSLITRDFVPLVYYCLCFVIILRVFQTYATAALAYSSWSVGVVDLLVLFATGSLEYVLFATIKAHGFLPGQFYTRLIVLASTGLFAYVLAFVRIGHEEDAIEYNLGLERLIQSVNVLCLALIAAICSAVLSFDLHTVPVILTAGLSISVILTTNMCLSLWITFSLADGDRSGAMGYCPSGSLNLPSRTELRNAQVLSNPETVSPPLVPVDEASPSKLAAAPGKLDIAVDSVPEDDTLVVPVHSNVLRGEWMRYNQTAPLALKTDIVIPIRHLAAYEPYPVSAITLLAQVESAVRGDSPGTVVITFSALSVVSLYVPKMKGGKNGALRSPKLASSVRLRRAQTLDDVW